MAVKGPGALGYIPLLHDAINFIHVTHASFTLKTYGFQG